MIFSHGALAVVCFLEYHQLFRSHFGSSHSCLCRPRFLPSMSRSMAAKSRLEDVLRIVAAAEMRRPLRERLLRVAVEAAVRESSGSSDAGAEEVSMGLPVVSHGAMDAGIIIAQEEALDVLGASHGLSWPAATAGGPSLAPRGWCRGPCARCALAASVAHAQRRSAP